MTDLPGGFKLENLIARRIELRDLLKKEKVLYEGRCAELKKEAALFDAWFLDYVTKTGQKNIATDVGLAYRYTWTSLKTADKQAWRKFALQHLELADIRPAKKEVEAFIEETKTLPSGLTMESGFRMGYRRAGEPDDTEEM